MKIVIIAKEVLHFMKHKHGEGALVSLKVGVMKDYNRVKLVFLMKVMKKFGFSARWCIFII